MIQRPRLLILGAHPDDAEFHGGGLATIYRQLDRTVKMVAVTDGSAGHHRRAPAELVELRRNEAARAGQVIGADYETWDFPDGKLQSTLDVRQRIIREIREFQPDLVLTHRTCDYHPDHRAVGQSVQDASYLVTVPHIVPEVAALRSDPVVALLPDLFTRPAPLRPDVIIDIREQMGAVSKMLACHASQVFEWLAYHDGIEETVPDNESERMAWVQSWFSAHILERANRIRAELTARRGDDGAGIEFIEMFEISEYARQPKLDEIRQLFPTMIE